MKVTVPNGSRKGSVTVPASKSWAHRMLITAALSDNDSEIICDGISKDILATASCLNALGAEVVMKDEGGSTVISVHPVQKANDKPGFFAIDDPLPFGPKSYAQESYDDYQLLCCGESGSTLRFLIPVAGSLGRKVVFYMEGRLSERPLEPLISVLKAHGMKFKQDGKKLYCSGQLKSGYYSIPGNISSQYISGLIMALSNLRGSSILEITGETESKDYISMTVEAVKTAGIAPIQAGNRYMIDDGPGYHAPSRLIVEKDWSSAAFPLCMGAFSEEGITVSGLNIDSVQGDKEILNVLRKFGAEVMIEPERSGDDQSIAEQSGGSDLSGLSSVTVKKPLKSGGDEEGYAGLSGLKSQVIDASSIPDLVPVISVVAAGSEGETRIVNAGRLRLKESDRLYTTATMLKALGAEIEETEDGLKIRGKRFLKGGKTDSFNDHRIAMSAAVAAGICKGAVEIEGAECTDKSFPGFWELLELLDPEK